MYYFGADKPQALHRYLERASHLHSGKASNFSTIYESISLQALCNLYLEHQHSRAEAGEIGLPQISDQTAVLREFVRYIGPNCCVSDMSTMDLQNYRSKLIKQGKSADVTCQFSRLIKKTGIKKERGVGSRLLCMPRLSRGNSRRSSSIFIRKQSVEYTRFRRTPLCLMGVEQPGRSAIRVTARHDRPNPRPSRASLSATGRFGPADEAGVTANRNCNCTL